MSNIDKRAKSVIRELIEDARSRRFGKLIITADEMEALLDELEAKDKQSADLFVENVRLKAGIAGLVSLGLRHRDIEVMRLAGDAQHSTPCTDSIIEKIAAGTANGE
ncbi:hypothetical protein EKN38_12825 [Enterobacter sp. WCHEn045836]|nr:hypothetical protein EKN38_12825 [Enterobacter sp. WCHEn045836]